MTDDTDDVMAGVTAATEEQWKTLWAAVDDLQAAGTWVTWHDPVLQVDGSWAMCWPEYSAEMNATIDGLYAVGAISSAFVWGEWGQGWDDARAAAIQTGPAADAVRFLTAVVRAERFGLGRLDRAMANGQLPAALERLRRWYEEER